ncbi:unnamed protein product, partial [marine sediment metagenome]
DLDSKAMDLKTLEYIHTQKIECKYGADEPGFKIK